MKHSAPSQNDLDKHILMAWGDSRFNENMNCDWNAIDSFYPEAMAAYDRLRAQDNLIAGSQVIGFVSGYFACLENGASAPRQKIKKLEETLTALRAMLGEK